MPSQNLGAPQTREESGEDWWFGHANYVQGNEIVGFITAGYAGWPNCYYKGEGCTFTIEEEIAASNTPSYNYTPRPKELETPNHRKGDTRGMVARFDLDGDPIWSRKLLPGQLFNVIEDQQGNIVAVGECDSNSWPNDLRPTDNDVIRWNNNSTLDVNEMDCAYFGNSNFKRKAYVVKLSPSGDILWCTFLTADNTPDGLLTSSEAFDIVEITSAQDLEYRVVGHGATLLDNTPRATVYRVNGDGILMNATRYQNGAIGTPSGWPNAAWSFFYSIAYSSVHDKMFISGAYPGALKTQAIGMLLSADDLDQQPDWFKTTVDAPDLIAAGHLVDKVNYTTGGGFVEAGSTQIVWPILSNFSYGDFYSGRKEASLFVHGFDLEGEWQWKTDLGLVHAYDLQCDMTATADGKVALVSSKRNNGVVPDGVFNWADLPGSAQACLTSTFSYPIQGNPDEYVNWPTTDLLDYWNTDPFVAKLDPTNGAMLWCTQWDADANSTHECSPGDLRNQECLYKITETPDGGLVISGNTSHNFDDYYLTKLHSDCQSKVQYFPLTLNSDGEYILSADETWNTNRNIYGTIVIPNGRTLTINGNATIRFADTQQLHRPTRIVVQPGGKLRVDNAVLAAVEGCPGSLWDGIMIQGDALASQYPMASQGRAELSNCTIAQSRVANLVANEFVMGQITGEDPDQLSGGVVYASNVSYRNNVYDVAFTPYENHTVSNPNDIRSNLSRFTGCHFLSDGDPNYPGAWAVDHVLLNFVRGVYFSGCDWGMDLATAPVDNYVQQGVGIHSINSTFVVKGRCDIPNWPAPGPPCPSTTNSRFSNLLYGIVASTFDPSRTFEVDGATFNRNNFGIYMLGVNDAAITRCTMDVAQTPLPVFGDINYGVYAEECTGYTIQENHFKGIPSGSSYKFGLIINYSGGAPNLVYNNTFDDLMVGTLVQGKNRNPETEEGLEIRCNDYGQSALNAFDIALTGVYPTIARQQGRNAQVLPIDPIDPTKPAGNIFSDNCGLQPEVPRDIFVQDDDSEYVQYWHHFSNTFHTEPICYNWIQPEPTGAVYASESACPTHLDQGGVVMLENAELGNVGYTEASAAYDATKDNGDSEGLIAYLVDPINSSVAKRNALLSVAPKASLDALKIAFNCEPALNDWHLTQALVGNSPLDGEVLQWTYESGLAPFFTGLIAGAQSGEVNLLSVLHAEMAYYGQLKAEALYGLGLKTWLDSTSTALDSLLVWTERYAPAHAKLAQAGVYSAKKNYAALELLAANEELISIEPERFGVLKTWAEAEQNGGWQLVDGSTVTYLQGLALQTDKMGSGHASAWLHALGSTLPPENIIPPNFVKSRSSRAAAVRTRPESQALELLDAYPNPTSGSQWLVYSLPEGSEQASIQIQDALGRVVMNTNVALGSTMLEVSTNTWNSGLYMARILADDMAIGNLKLIVKR